MLIKADRTTSEEGWRVEDFPSILDEAIKYKLACFGGQFQFRGPIGVAEMYWLNADSEPRKEGELWEQYVKRSCREVRDGFDILCRSTNFIDEAKNWEHITKAVKDGSNPLEHLYFVAYFEEE